MKAPNNILVLRGGALGDFVLTLPVFAELRRQCPGIRIGCAGYPRVTALAAAAGLVDETFSLDAVDAARLFAPDAFLSNGWRKRLGAYDTAVSYLHDPDGTVRRSLLRAGVKRVIAHSPFVTAGRAADHFLKPLAALGLAVPAGAVPRLRLDGHPAHQARERMIPAAGKTVVLHPGSGGPEKNWPPGKFATLFDRLRKSNVPAVFLIGEAETGIADKLRATMLGAPALQEPDLVRLAALLTAACAYVGNDSGVTHLAAAVGTSVVALFGPTDPGVWGPGGPNVQIIRAARPTKESLGEVPVETVLRAVREKIT